MNVKRMCGLGLISGAALFLISASDETELGRKIAELGAGDFATRQAAEVAVWEYGDDAVASLRKVARGDDPEVAFRARRILEFLSMGLSPDSPPELVESVREFENLDDAGRLELINKLVGEDELDVALFLSSRKASGSYLSTEQSLQLVATYVRKKSPKEEEGLKLLRLVPESIKTDFAIACYVQGTPLAEGLAKELQAAQMTRSEARQVTLIRALSDDYDGAYSVAKEYELDELRRRIIVLQGDPVPLIASEMGELQREREEFHRQVLAQWKEGAEGVAKYQDEWEQAKAGDTPENPGRFAAVLGRKGLIFSQLPPDRLADYYESIEDHLSFIKTRFGVDGDEALLEVLYAEIDELSGGTRLGEAPSEDLLIAINYYGVRGDFRLIDRVAALLKQAGGADKRQEELLKPWAESLGNLSIEVTARLVESVEEGKQRDILAEAGFTIYSGRMGAVTRNTARQIFEVFQERYGAAGYRATLAFYGLGSVPGVEIEELIAAVEESDIAKEDVAIGVLEIRPAAAVIAERLLKDIPLAQNRHAVLLANSYYETGMMSGDFALLQKAKEHVVQRNRFDQDEFSSLLVESFEGRKYLPVPYLPFIRSSFGNLAELDVQAAIAAYYSQSELAYQLAKVRFLAGEEANENGFESTSAILSEQAFITQRWKIAAAAGQHALLTHESRFMLPDKFTGNMGRVFQSVARVLTARGLLASEQGKAEESKTYLSWANELYKGSGLAADEFFPAIRGQVDRELYAELYFEAIATIREAMERFPQGADLHNSAAWLASRAVMDLEEALQWSEKAHVIEPYNPAYLDTLAEVWFAKGDREKALDLSKKALGFSSRDALLWMQFRHFHNDPLPN